MTSPYRVQTAEVCPWCHGTGLGWVLPGGSEIIPCYWCKKTGLAAHVHTSPEEMHTLGMSKGWTQWAIIAGNQLFGLCLNPLDPTGPLIPTWRAFELFADSGFRAPPKPSPAPPAGHSTWEDYDEYRSRRDQERMADGRDE